MKFSRKIFPFSLIIHDPWGTHVPVSEAEAQKYCENQIDGATWFEFDQYTVTASGPSMSSTYHFLKAIHFENEEDKLKFMLRWV